MKDALIIIPQGFEEIEAICPIDLLRRADLNVEVAALDYPIQVTGRSRLEIMADGALDSFINESFRAIILIGGPGYPAYRQKPALINKLKKHKGIIAAICAAPIALHDAGLLAGKRYTCHNCVRNELSAALDQAVVIDENLITADGAGHAFEFGLTLVEKLTDTKTRQQLASDTGYKG